MISFLTLFFLKRYAHFRKKVFDMTFLINFVNSMIIKKKWTLLITISQVSQYFNQIFNLRSFLIGSREIFSHIPAKKKMTNERKLFWLNCEQGLLTTVVDDADKKNRLLSRFLA